MKHYLIESAEELDGEGDIKLPPYAAANGAALIFHYHLYNFPVDEVLNHPIDSVDFECFHRVVFQTVPIKSLRALDSLWHDVVGELHFYDEENIRLIECSSMPVALCQNCGTSDIVMKRKPCALCDAPLCRKCYSTQPYCMAHLC
jgi:hypothetical protein